MKKLRFGFLSTANIGRKNWKAIFHSGNSIVSAVASRDVQKSRKFIDDCQREFAFAETPRAFGSYAELIASPDVDAIYFPLPTGLRKEWVVRAAAAGKHIVCEKPCAANLAELDEMLTVCCENQVQFMDGVMFMHNPRLPKIRAVLDDGRSVGPLRRIVSNFGTPNDEAFFLNNIRADAGLEPAGSLGDLGWYSIYFALWIMNWRLPDTVCGRILSSSARGAPVDFTGELVFAGGVSAGFYCSFRMAWQQWAHVSGDKGWLRLPDFVQPFNSYEPAFELNEKTVMVSGDVKCPPGVDPFLRGHATAQDTQMWRNFARQVFSGQLNDDWPMWSRQTQMVMDACLESARRDAPVKMPLSVRA